MAKLGSCFFLKVYILKNNGAGALFLIKKSYFHKDSTIYSQ